MSGQDLMSSATAFGLSFFVSLVLLTTFVFVYCLITPYRELDLVRQGNRAAAYSLGGAIIGFVIPVAKAVSQSADLADLAIWAAIAFVAQLIAYGAAVTLVPQTRQAIAGDQVASGLFVATMAIAIGILNAASMTV